MRFNQIFYKKHGYKVTTEPANKYTDKELVPIIKKFHPLLTDVPFVTSKVVAELEGLVKRYPEVLPFTNFLYIAYHKNNQKKKAIEYLQETAKKYPHYLFATINMANHYITENHFDRAAALLIEPFDVRNIEKDEVIHITSFLSYYQTAIKIEIGRKNVKQAEALHRLLFDYDKKHEIVQELALEILAARAANFPDMAAPIDRKVEEISKPISGQYLSDGKGQPIFNHPEINQLYQYSLDKIPKSVIESILSLPRPTLIQDLEHVVCDTVLRNDYYVNNDNWTDDTHQFTIHAIYLLTELKSFDSLPCILGVLKQDSEFSDYWFTDWIDNYFNETMYILGENQLDLLKSFVLEENLSPWHRLLAIDTVTQIALKQPERRAEVIEWLREVIRFHLDNPKNDNLIDSNFLGILVNDLLDIKAIELKEEIQELYATGWVSNFDAGSVQEVLAELELPIEPDSIKPLPNDIFELYNKDHVKRKHAEKILVQETDEDESVLSDIDKNFNDPYNVYMRELTMSILSKGLDDDDDYDDYDDDDYDDWKPQLPIKREEPKVGRNDPCPCGSGKKYKKCHGK